MKCNGDYCEIDTTDYKKVAEQKLNEWLYHLDPYDYDAPGSTVREQGV